MKILFAINTLEKGGAERVLSNLITYLSLKKHDIAVVMLEKKNIAYPISKPTKLFYAIKEQKYSKIRILKMIKKIYIAFIQIINIKKIINNVKPDVIVTFLPEMSFRILLANNKNIPIIVSVRNDPKIEYHNPINKFLMKKLYPKATGFIFQTKEAKEYFSNKIVDSYEIIPNPINKEFIKEPYEREREKVIVSVGRLTKQKNQKMLIEAFAELANDYKEYKLVIYGEGELRKELQDLIRKYDLCERIILPGKEDNIKEKIYKANIFVLCSNYEGMPNALMEAMALGVPVISTDCPCGGPKFLIQNNINGILVENNNKEQLKKAMLKILNDKEFSNKISREANNISKALNPDIINNKFEQYIETIGGKFKDGKNDKSFKRTKENKITFSIKKYTKNER